MNTTVELGTLGEQALKRRERLKNLKQRLGDKNEDTENKETCTDNSELPRPVFRSYVPQDETLKENTLPRAKPESVEEQIKDHLEAAKPEPLISEVDLTTLAPRKPDWDLKRDVAKKLEKLDRRTQRAIAELIRERLKENDENLAEVVNAYSVGPAPENVDSDDD